jgi:hypothetical protein
MIRILLFIYYAFVYVAIHSLFGVSLIEAQTVPRVVISELQIAGSKATDEFVELYNPMPEPVEMVNWKLVRTNSSGAEGNLVTSLNGTIPAYGFFLIAHPDYSGSVTPDVYYSAASNNIVANGGVKLLSESGNVLVDMVGWGTSPIYEGVAAPQPNAGESLERKATADASVESMADGGIHATWGNGFDSHHNEFDFLIRAVPEPQHSMSQFEMLPLPMPTATLTPTLAPATPTPEATPEPTPEPTGAFSPTPTPEPTQSPDAERLFGWQKPGFFMHQCGMRPFPAMIFSRAFTFYLFACTN